MKLIPNKNFFLVPTDKASDLVLKGKIKEDFFLMTREKEPFIKTSLYQPQLLIITDDSEIKNGKILMNSTIKGWGIFENDSNKNQNKFLSLVEDTYNIIASNSTELTPHHLISEKDLKFIVEHWNEFNELPSGELTRAIECSKIQCNGECVKCEYGEIVPKTSNNEVVINWHKMSHSHHFAPTEDTIVIDDISEKINSGQDAKQIVNEMISDGLKSGKYIENEGKDEHGNPIKLITTQQGRPVDFHWRHGLNKKGDKLTEEKTLNDLKEFVSKTYGGLTIFTINEVIDEYLKNKLI
jgi:hypothetical protein